MNAVAFLDGINVRLHLAGEETAVVLPGFHHHGKICQLRGAVVDIQAPEVVLHNAGSGFTGGIAVILVNLHKHIKKHAENVPRPGTGVDGQDFLRLQRGVLLANFRQLRLNVRLLLCFIKIIFPFGFQLVVWMSLQPQAAQAILHHILYWPVWCINCGCSGKQFFGDTVF